MAKLADAAPASGDPQRKNSIAQSIAEFDGSFAPNARPTDARQFPWYRSREYFLGGWINLQLWKAAVCPFTLLSPDLAFLTYSTPSLSRWSGRRA